VAQTTNLGDVTAITIPKTFSDLTGNVTVSNGTQANLQKVLPLAFGQMYFAQDTGNLYFGTPGSGLGYIQIGDTTAMNDTLIKVLNELRAMRAALVQLACDGNKARPQDFDPQTLANDAEATAGNL
jgi:hypothetical protein